MHIVTASLITFGTMLATFAWLASAGISVVLQEQSYIVAGVAIMLAGITKRG